MATIRDATVLFSLKTDRNVFANPLAVDIAAIYSILERMYDVLDIASILEVADDVIPPVDTINNSSSVTANYYDTNYSAKTKNANYIMYGANSLSNLENSLQTNAFSSLNATTTGNDSVCSRQNMVNVSAFSATENSYRGLTTSSHSADSYYDACERNDKSGAVCSASCGNSADRVQRSAMLNSRVPLNSAVAVDNVRVPQSLSEAKTQVNSFNDRQNMLGNTCTINTLTEKDLLPIGSASTDYLLCGYNMLHNASCNQNSVSDNATTIGNATDYIYNSASEGHAANEDYIYNSVRSASKTGVYDMHCGNEDCNNGMDTSSVWSIAEHVGGYGTSGAICDNHAIQCMERSSAVSVPRCGDTEVAQGEAYLNSIDNSHLVERIEERETSIINGTSGRLQGADKQHVKDFYSTIKSGDTNMENNTARRYAKEDVKNKLHGLASQHTTNDESNFTERHVEINVQMGGVTNNIAGEVDVQNVMDKLCESIETAVSVSAEGVHF